MTPKDQTPRALLEFSDAWFDLGIVTELSVAELAQQYQESDDRNKEHYRWRAFRAFYNRSRPFSAETLRALYDLGKRDPDAAMGSAIQFEVVAHPDCPTDLLVTAAQEERKALVRLAEKRLREREQKETAL